MTWDTITASAPYIRAKRLRALGIASAKRSALMPEIPTISESGVTGYELSSWYAMYAPAATPQDIVRLLHREVVKALDNTQMREQFAALGADLVGNTPEELMGVMQRDLVKWAKVARDANVKAE